MSDEEKLFHSVGASINGAVKGQLFGKQCYKIEGKAFTCFFENDMVFKLSNSFHGEALQLSKSQLFDPSKKQRPMKEWVQVSYDHHDEWLNFAKAAAQYVSSTLKR